MSQEKRQLEASFCQLKRGFLELCTFSYPGQERRIIIETQPKALNPPRIESDTESKGCQASKYRIYNNGGDSERISLGNTKASLIHNSVGKKVLKSTCG